MTGPWDILETTEFSDWFAGLTAKQREAVSYRRELLRQMGPATPRPYVDTITGSALPNLKELRVSSQGSLRILFAFDTRRRAVLLLGGDKSEGGAWNGWYPTAIARAEELFVQHLKNMEKGT